MSEFKLKFRYENGVADHSRLDLYDGAVSLNGIARAMTIATHALINKEVRTRADRADGAEFYLVPPRRGSFEYEALIFTTGAISSGLFYDFVKHVFREAVGLEDLANPPRRSVQSRIEPTLGELPAVLESALIDVHRPIKKDPDITLTIQRQRGESLVVFDRDTEIYLHPTTVIVPDPIVGNVTRYNTPSRWGRLYDRAEGKIVSFYLEPNVSERGRSLITWSLHETNMNRDGTIYLRAEAVISANERLKRYNVSAVSDQPFA